MSEHYPSDLTDGQWQLIRPLLPKRAKRGRPPIDRREILDAVLYVVRTGCQWRQLPLDFPKWKTVYTVFRRWRKAGIWEQIHNVLRQRVRRSVGKQSKPTAAILDSQSVRTAEGGEQRGYDAGKKITGRKRHLAVDTLGLVWAVVVHGADWQDHEGAHFVLMLLNQQCRRHFGQAPMRESDFGGRLVRKAGPRKIIGCEISVEVPGGWWRKLPEQLPNQTLYLPS